MKDDVVQLLARGQQDIWLSGEPEVSFYRSAYKRHVPFATSIERFLVPLDGRVTLNPKCDLLSYVYLTAHDKTTGALIPGLDWSTIVSTVDLVIGNQTIATHDMTYINTIQSVLEAPAYSNRAQTSFQPLGFFFDTKPLPLVSLRYTDVRLFLNLLTTQYVIKVWAHCIHLGDDERKYFATTPQKMLIPIVQRVPISTEPYLRGPIKYFAGVCKNYSKIYGPISLSGNVQWGSRIGGTGDDTGNSIAVDSSGSVYITGYYSSNPLTLYNKDGSAFATTLTNSGSYDVFIAKYDTNGNVLWVSRISGGSAEFCNSIAVDSSGSVYVTGYYSSNPLTLYNKDGSAFATTLTNSGSNDVFIAKYDTNGNVLWGSRIGGTGDDFGNSIAVDSSGSVYVTGYYFSNPLTLYNKDGSAFSTTLTNLPGDVFIAKYDTNGNVLWGSRISGGSAEFGNSIAVDSSGSVYITGYYFSNPLTLYNKNGSAFATTLTNSGSNDAFIAKYDTNGNVLWGSRIGGTGDDTGISIAVDSSGSVYVTGPYSSNPLTLYNKNGSAFATTLTNSGSNDTFIVKYNTNGNVLWGSRIGGTGDDFCNSIAVDSSGSVYITGYYSSNPLTLYNKDGSAFATTLTNSGSRNVFIAKYDTNGNVLWGSRIGGTGVDFGNSIAVDSSGSVYVTGPYSSSTLTLYNNDGSAFSTTLTNSSPSDILIAKYYS